MPGPLLKSILRSKKHSNIFCIEVLLGLFKPFGLQPAAVASVTGRVANFESEDAQPGDNWDIISGAGTGSSFSTDRNITIEKNTHDIGAILDTLGIQKLFAQLDPTFDIDKGGQILKAASAITNSSNETLLRALHQLISLDRKCVV